MLGPGCQSQVAGARHTPDTVREPSRGRHPPGAWLRPGGAAGACAPAWPAHLVTLRPDLGTVRVRVRVLTEQLPAPLPVRPTALAWLVAFPPGRSHLTRPPPAACACRPVSEPGRDVSQRVRLPARAVPRAQAPPPAPHARRRNLKRCAGPPEGPVPAPGPCAVRVHGYALHFGFRPAPRPELRCEPRCAGRHGPRRGLDGGTRRVRHPCSQLCSHPELPLDRRLGHSHDPRRARRLCPQAWPCGAP